MRSLMLTLVLMSFYSCGQQDDQFFAAPQSRNRLGLITKCVPTAEAQSVAKTHGLEYRIISKKYNVVEFVGASVEQLKKWLPNAKIKRNKFYQIQSQTIESQSLAEKINDPPYYGEGESDLRREPDFFNHLTTINAYDIIEHNHEVVVAIVDTGLAYNHPHIRHAIKTNENDPHSASEEIPAEEPLFLELLGDGRDNDNNGLVDDYIGWDFFNFDAYPYDDNGHGTHISGLVAGSLGGVAPHAKILPIKVLSASGRGDLGTISAGILYAIERKVDIINLSLGTTSSGGLTDDLQELLDITNLAKENNILMVAAAGNGGDDAVGDCNDEAPIYPANFESENMISVAATDLNGELTSYSNYGPETVHIAAPGGNEFEGGLLSLALPFCQGACDAGNSPYTLAMGTSMAAPVVAGVLANMIGESDEGVDVIEIRRKLIQSTQVRESLEGKIVSGLVDQELALKSL